LSGCYGDSEEDRGRAAQLDRHLLEEFREVPCAGCHYLFEASELDEDDFCKDCAEQDDELDDIEEDQDSSDEFGFDPDLKQKDFAPSTEELK